MNNCVNGPDAGTISKIATGGSFSSFFWQELIPIAISTKSKSLKCLMCHFGFLTCDCSACENTKFLISKQISWDLNGL